MYNRRKRKVKVRIEEAGRQARQTSKILASLKNLFLSQDPLLLLSNWAWTNKLLGPSFSGPHFWSQLLGGKWPCVATDAPVGIRPLSPGHQADGSRWCSFGGWVPSADSSLARGLASPPGTCWGPAHHSICLLCTAQAKPPEDQLVCLYTEQSHSSIWCRRFRPWASIRIPMPGVRLGGGWSLLSITQVNVTSVSHPSPYFLTCLPSPYFELKMSNSKKNSLPSVLAMFRYWNSDPLRK